jgi:hypothetical protein
MKKGRSKLHWVSQLMVPGQREWDENVLQTCLYPHDAVEVLKNRPMQNSEEDFIAWFYEKTGIFTVKSAYKLAQDLEHMASHDIGTSSNTSGVRPMYQEIWRMRVPPKVLIFAWKVAQKCLATQESRRNRALVDRAICTLCGKMEEMVHHALIRCSKASTLGRKCDSIYVYRTN